MSTAFDKCVCVQLIATILYQNTLLIKPCVIIGSPLIPYPCDNVINFPERMHNLKVLSNTRQICQTKIKLNSVTKCSNNSTVHVMCGGQTCYKSIS